MAAHPDDGVLGAGGLMSMLAASRARLRLVAATDGERSAAGAFYCFPVWMWHRASPGDPRVPWDRALRIPLPLHTATRKRAAITRFASQTEDRGHGLGPVLAPGMIAHFTRAMEVLLP